MNKSHPSAFPGINTAIKQIAAERGKTYADSIDLFAQLYITCALGKDICETPLQKQMLQTIEESAHWFKWRVSENHQIAHDQVVKDVKAVALAACADFPEAV